MNVNNEKVYEHGLVHFVFMYFCIFHFIALGHIYFIFNPFIDADNWWVVPLYLVYVIYSYRVYCKGRTIYKLSDDGLRYNYFVSFRETKTQFIPWNNIISAKVHGSVIAGHPVNFLQIELEKFEPKKPVYGELIDDFKDVSGVRLKSLGDLFDQVKTVNNFIVQYKSREAQ